MPTSIDLNAWLYSFVELCLILVVGVLSLTSKSDVVEMPLGTVAAAEMPNKPTTRPATDSLTINVITDQGAPEGMRFELAYDSKAADPKLALRGTAIMSDIFDKLPDYVGPGFNGRVTIRPSQAQSVQNFVTLWTAVARQCQKVNAKCEIGLQARPLNARELDRSEFVVPVVRPN